MGPSAAPIRVGMDAGSTHTRCVILGGREGQPHLLGASVVPSDGWHEGRIRNTETVAGSLAAAALSAGARAGIAVTSVTIGYADEFAQMDELTRALEAAGLRPDDFAPEAEAALLATTSDIMRQGGISVAVIGADATELAYSDLMGGVQVSSIISAARHFTADLSALFSLPVTEAEHLKVTEGSILTAAEGRPSAAPPTPMQEVLEARAGQLLHLMAFRLEQMAGTLPPPGGLILTGGGAALPGLCRFAEAHLRCPVRLGQVVGVADWPLEMSSPAWTTAAGLALQGGANHGW